MSYPIFDDLTTEFPQERDAISRLRDFLTTGAAREVTLGRLVDVTKPQSVEALALIMTRLIRQHFVRKFVRVESPDGRGGIGDYASVLDVPPSVHDWRTGEDVDVTPENVQVLFTPSMFK